MEHICCRLCLTRRLFFRSSAYLLFKYKTFRWHPLTNFSKQIFLMNPREPWRWHTIDDYYKIFSCFWLEQTDSFSHPYMLFFVRSIQSPTKVSMEDIIVMANNKHQFTCIPARTIAKGSLCVTNGNIWCDFLYFIGGLEGMHSFTTFLIFNMEHLKWDVKIV